MDQLENYLYVSLAQELAQGMAQGLYAAGDRLPGVRGLAQQRGVSIASVLSAYRYLEAQGLIEARDRSGFYVRARPQVPAPSVMPVQISHPTLVNGHGMAMHKAARNSNLVQLGVAVPDASYLPTRAVERALAEVAHRYRSRTASYEVPPGAPELCRQIAKRMTNAGCAISAEEIVITNGCQEAITLALRAVTQPGDVVAIESPTYYGLLQVIEALGLKALEIPTHPQEGVSLAALALALEQWPIKACILVANFSNPLGYSMSDAAKQALVDLLARHEVPLIEDDVYGDLSFDARRPSLCRSFAKGSDVIYCASFSKTLSPGLRIGWIAPGRYQDRIEYLKYISNIATGTVPQLAVAELLETGRYDRHLREVRQLYARAVARMQDAIRRWFPEGTNVSQPGGGFVLWIEGPPDLDANLLAQRASEAGITIAPGPIFSATGKYRHCFRLSCACKWDERTERALATLGRLLPECAGAGRVS